MKRPLRRRNQYCPSRPRLWIGIVVQLIGVSLLLDTLGVRDWLSSDSEDEKEWPIDDEMLDPAAASIDSCPLGLVFGNEMSALNKPPEHEQKLFPAPEPKNTDGGISVENEYQIPKVIVWFHHQPDVPAGMAAAMETLTSWFNGKHTTSGNDQQPKVRWRTFHLTSGMCRPWLYRNSEKLLQRLSLVGVAPSNFIVRAFDELSSPKMRAQLTIWCYLLLNGGVYLHNGFLAETKAKDSGAIGLYRFFSLFNDDKVDFVGLRDFSHPYRSDFFSDELVAIKPRHQLMEKLVMAALNAATNGVRGLSPDDMTGSAALTRVVHQAYGLGITADGMVRRGAAFLALHRHRHCLIGQISMAGRRMFWSRYPMFGRETRWYRGGDEDYRSTWMKHHELRSAVTWNTRRKAWNVQPRWNGILRDLPAFRPAYTSLREAPYLDVVTIHSPEEHYLRRIPRKLVVTNFKDQVPKDTYEEHMHTVFMNPDYEVHFYSDRRIRPFIEKHFASEPKVIAAYDALIPGAYKADLFRYCWLLVNGGVYMDMDFHSHQPLDRLIDDSDEFVVAKDCFRNNVYNAFIAAVPGSPVVRLLLDTAVERITRRLYGWSSLWLTGPTMVASALSEYISCYDQYFAGKEHSGEDDIAAVCNSQTLVPKLLNESETWSEELPIQPSTFYVNRSVKILPFVCDNAVGRLHFINHLVGASEGTKVLVTPFASYLSEVRWYAPLSRYRDRWKHRQIYR